MTFRFLRYNGRLLDCKSAAQERRTMILMERVQNDAARSISYNFKRVFKSMHADIKKLDHIPDLLELNEIIRSHYSWEQRILADAYSKMSDIVLPMVADEGVLKSIEANIQKKADQNTELYKLRIMDWINQYAGVHITYIDDTTLKDIQRLMADTSTTEEFQQSISSYFKTDAPSRAYTIARTESHCAATVSADISVRSTDIGRKKVKVWKATNVNTRETHRQMNGVQVGMDDLFQVPRTDGGIDLMAYPGDTVHGAGAGNIVNCRCLCFYRYA